MEPDESLLPPLLVSKSYGDVIRKTWAFCPVTGSLLILDAANGVARSEHCPFSRPLSDLDDTMMVVTESNMDLFQRQFVLDPLLKTREQLEFEQLLKSRVRATVEEPCPRCKAPIMEYHTMQLRSADEGQVGRGWGRAGGAPTSCIGRAALGPWIWPCLGGGLGCMPAQMWGRGSVCGGRAGMRAPATGLITFV